VNAIRSFVRSLFVDDPAVWMKQLPTAIGVAFAIAITFSISAVGPTDLVLALIGIGIVAAATALAVAIGPLLHGERYTLLVPVLSLFGIGLFRAGTGGIDSPYTSLIILPITWIASYPGRKYIWLAIAGTSAALLLPYAVAMNTPQHAGEWLAGIFPPVVFGLAAIIINELARQARRRLVKTRRLAEGRKALLDDMTRYTKKIEENEGRLRTANRLTSSVLNSVTEQSIIGTDLTGLIDVWNPGASALLGLTPTDTEGTRYVFEFHLPEELEQRSRELNHPPGATVLNPGFSALVEPARQGGSDVRNWTYLKADGSRVTVEVAVTPRSNENGETIGYIFVAADVSHAIKLAHLKDEFVGMISHELRTPLSSVLGYLELLQDDQESPMTAEQKQYLSVAERNAQRLLHLVGDLLFTAQVESGMFPIVQTELDPRRLVAAALDTARPAASGAGVEVNSVLSEQSLVVSGDPGRLAQAFDNLISNAIKFTPRGGSVTVCLSESVNEVIVSVKDTGMGIPANELSRLTNRFFRASTATRNAVPGVGLGLSITKAIVAAHGGHLDVQSTEGTGTTFTMHLPMAGHPSLSHVYDGEESLQR
jgi:signal transduction histidine kinase